jgi:hypothetical protein
LALRDDGTINGFGIDMGGYSPIPNVQFNKPLEIPQEIQGNVTGVFAINFDAFALLKNGRITGWGYPKPIGYANSTDFYNFPESIQNNIKKVSTSLEYHLLLLKDGSITGFGRNEECELEVPNYVSNNAVDVVDVSAGGNHAYALLRDGTITGWGNCVRLSQIIRGDLTPPQGVQGNVTGIYAGLPTIAILKNGSLTGWFDYSNYNIPYSEINGNDISGISHGLAHVLIHFKNGTVSGWGNGKSFNPDAHPFDAGQLMIPQSIQGRVKDVKAGPFNSIALLNDGSINGWGTWYKNGNDNSILVDIPACSNVNCFYDWPDGSYRSSALIEIRGLTSGAVRIAQAGTVNSNIRIDLINKTFSGGTVAEGSNTISFMIGETVSITKSSFVDGLYQIQSIFGNGGVLACVGTPIPPPVSSSSRSSSSLSSSSSTRFVSLPQSFTTFKYDDWQTRPISSTITYSNSTDRNLTSNSRITSKNLVGVTIGTNVTGIGTYALGVPDLKGDMNGDGILTIPGNVKAIGPASFNGCNLLTKVVFGSGIESIGSNAFVGCGSIREFRFLGDPPSLGNGAFGVPRFNGIPVYAHYCPTNNKWNQLYGGTSRYGDVPKVADYSCCDNS